MEQAAAVEVVESFATRIEDRHGDYANAFELVRQRRGEGEGDDAAHRVADDVGGLLPFDDREEVFNDAFEGVLAARTRGAAVPKQVWRDDSH